MLEYLQLSLVYTPTFLNVLGRNMLSISEMAKPLKQSGIRAASALCRAQNGINLGQGICDIPVIDEIKQGAVQAIMGDKSIYSPCEGEVLLRQAIAKKVQSFNRFQVNPETEIMVSHGATGAFVCATKVLFNAGDEVILFEPFYGYHKNILDLMNVNVVSVPINRADYSIDVERMSEVLTPKTKGIIVCTPNNPTGKVYSKEELLAIGEFACRHDLAIITDEIYEYITYPGFEHISMASLSDELRQRTLTISGFSKTFNMTGWRLGYVSGPAYVIEKMSLIQDYYYVCPVTPLQHAGIQALSVPDSYYENLRVMFIEKKALTVNALKSMGFDFVEPQGAYYILANCQHFNKADSQAVVDHLMQEAGVATVSGSAFYLNPNDGTDCIRFCYALDTAILSKAYQQLEHV